MRHAEVQCSNKRPLRRMDWQLANYTTNIKRLDILSFPLEKKSFRIFQITL